MGKSASTVQKSESKKFIAAAKKAECDESEATFEEKLKRIAKVKPKKAAKK